MRTRCKFVVQGVEDLGKLTVPGETVVNGKGYSTVTYVDSGKRIQNIRLAACYDPSVPEDVNFAATTPTGEMKFMVTNLVVSGTFAVGDEYYVILEPVKKD